MIILMSLMKPSPSGFMLDGERGTEVSEQRCRAAMAISTCT